MCMCVYMSTRVLLRSCMWRAEKGGQELLLQRGRGDPPQGSLCGGGSRRWRSSPPTSLSWERPHLPGSPARGPRPERLGGLAEVPQPVRGGTQREATVAAGAVGGRPVQPRVGVGWSGRAGTGRWPPTPSGERRASRGAAPSRGSGGGLRGPGSRRGAPLSPPCRLQRPRRRDQAAGGTAERGEKGPIVRRGRRSGVGGAGARAQASPSSCRRAAGSRQRRRAEPAEGAPAAPPQCGLCRPGGRPRRDEWRAGLLSREAARGPDLGSPLPGGPPGSQRGLLGAAGGAPATTEPPAQPPPRHTAGTGRSPGPGAPDPLLPREAWPSAWPPGRGAARAPTRSLSCWPSSC